MKIKLKYFHILNKTKKKYIQINNNIHIIIK